MHDDQSDATNWAAALMARMEVFMWGETWLDANAIDSTAIVLDDQQKLLPVHNSTTERCGIMDNNEPL